MSKARIVERTEKNGTKRYLIQFRFLFWWFDTDDTYGSLAEAKKKMCFYDGTKTVDRVVGEDQQHEPDPAVAELVLKLKSVFDKRLKEEDDPEDFLHGMRPNVLHELRHWTPTLVNESPGKLYIFDSPVHGGKVILVDGEFANKILAFGGFPC